MVALVLPLGSCGWGAGSGSRSLPVQTLTLQPLPFEDLGDYVATLEAVDAVQLAAVVPGRVRQRLVQEGQQVEQGQVLLQLSSEERRADVAKALADVAQRQADQAAAQAALEQARRNHERYAYLGSEGAASAQELDSYQAEFLAAQAKLKASRDGVRAAAKTARGKARKQGASTEEIAAIDTAADDECPAVRRRAFKIMHMPEANTVIVEAPPAPRLRQPRASGLGTH